MTSPKGPIPAMWEVPQAFRDRMGQTAGRQRAMEADQHLLLILHGPPEGEDDHTREGRLFWRHPDGKWRATVHGGGVGALSKHLSDYQERIDQLEKKEKTARNAEDHFQILNEATPLNRAAGNMLDTLQQAREMVPKDRDLITYRDEAYTIRRQAELLLSDTRNSLDYYLARKAEEQARQSHQMVEAGHRLNVLAAIFLPLATLSSLLGMNIKHGLEEAKPPLTFLVVAGAGILIGLFMKSLLMNPARGDEKKD